MTIASQYEAAMTTQSYETKPLIDGVEMIDQTYFGDDGGNFTEIIRIDEDGHVEALEAPFKVRQLSFSLLMPGTIKAYHVHKEQDDVWFVPPNDRLLVNLHDVRENSTTFDQHMRFVLGGGRSKIVRIPNGVAHGIANLYQRPMRMTYATNQQFNANDPDEHRLPWDLFGEDVWQVTKG